MAMYDERIDAYIERAAPFAKPLLASLREQVHAACADTREAIKWGAPAFLYRGKILCLIAAFKHHVVLDVRYGGTLVATPPAASAMGQFGRITAPAELPDRDGLARCLQDAIALIDAGGAPTRKASPERPAPAVPDDLAAALQGAAAAQAAFDAFAPGHRREYIEWILDAKRGDTRLRRIAQTVEWLGEGRTRHWKYARAADR